MSGVCPYSECVIASTSIPRYSNIPDHPSNVNFTTAAAYELIHVEDGADSGGISSSFESLLGNTARKLQNLFLTK